MAMSKLNTSARLVLGRCLLKSKPAIAITRSAGSKRLTAYEEMSHYWAKNQKLGRPISPHVTVHKFHMTMALSIFNRILAVGLHAGIVGASVAIVFLPGDFTTYLKKFQALEPNQVLIVAAKFLVAFPFAFHLMAGLRHLVWDAGIGFSKQATLQGGWVVLATTLAFTTLLVFGVKPSAL